MREREKRGRERQADIETERGGGSERKGERERERVREKGREIEREGGRQGGGIEGNRERQRVSRGNYVNKCLK